MRNFYLFTCLTMIIVAASAQTNSITKHSSMSDSSFSAYIQPWAFYADSETVSIEINGVSSHEMRYYVKQRSRIVIQSTENTIHPSFLTLPVRFDPSARIISPINEKLSSDWSGIRDQNLNASIIRQKQTRPLRMDVKVRTVETGSYKYGVSEIVPEHIMYGKNDYFDYSISESLNPGDTLIFEISYSISFIENVDKLLNFRYMFNRDYPIRYAELNMDVPKAMWFEFESFNNCQPDTGFISDASRKYLFRFSNLSGAFSEPNSIAWRELPNAVFIVHPLDFTYTIPNTLTVKHIPQYSVFAEYRDFTGRSIRLDISQGVNNSESINMNKFLENQIGSKPDVSTNLANIEKIHNLIAQSFVYSNDSAYYKNEITAGPDFGESSKGGVLREFYRYEPYKYMLEKLKQTYFFGFLADKRSGLVSKHYVIPFSQDDYLLLIVRDSAHYDIIYPKLQKSGYFYNEIPFYFEGTDIASVHFTDYYLDPKNQRELPDSLFLSKTPKNDILENSRKFTSLVTVSTNNGKAKFQTKGFLSGQFSTLGRGSYLNNEVHPFVDPAYSHRIFDIPGAKLLTPKPVYNQSTEKPFKFSIECVYETPIESKSGEIKIALKNWFPFVLPEAGQYQRTTNIYTDFLFTDTYIYQLVFDKDVTIANLPQDFNIDNAFGKLIFSVKQADGKTYTISAQLILNHEMLRPEKISNLIEISEAVANINNLVLTFKAE